VRFLVAPISEPAALAHDHETAFRQHANRRGVVARSASVKRTGRLQLQELLEGTRGNAVAPVFTADPIGDLAPALQVEARNVTHNSTVDLDHPVRRRAVAPQPRPPSLEARSMIELRRSERGHPYSVAIARVLEEHAEITIFDLAKDKRSRALRHGEAHPWGVVFHALFLAFPVLDRGSWPSEHDQSLCARCPYFAGI